jgi:thiol:disulfide interchange protein
MKKPVSRKIISITILAVVLIAAYFVFIQYQTYLGRQALAATGLTSLPLDQALARAKAESKMVLVDVSAIWCPNCRALDKNVFADSRVKQVIDEKYVFARLEYESPEGTSFLKEHGAKGFPNLWLLDENGDVIKHLTITYDPAEFLEQISS